MKETILRVGSNTDINRLKGAVVECLRINNRVFLDAIGVAANYTATKAIINIRGYLKMHSADVIIAPIFTNVPVGNIEKTAVRWILEKVEAC